MSREKKAEKAANWLNNHTQLDWVVVTYDDTPSIFSLETSYMKNSKVCNIFVEYDIACNKCLIGIDDDWRQAAIVYKKALLKEIKKLLKLKAKKINETMNRLPYV